MLKNISAEVYLVWDKKDSETPYWICKKIHKLTRQSKIITYYNGGHFAAFNNANKFALLINGIVGN